jgi:hypothetical protein
LSITKFRNDTVARERESWNLKKLREVRIHSSFLISASSPEDSFEESGALDTKGVPCAQRRFYERNLRKSIEILSMEQPKQSEKFAKLS